MLPASFVPIIAAITSSAESTSIACFAAVIVVASVCTTIGSTVATFIRHSDDRAVAAVIGHSADGLTGCSAAFSTRSSTAKFTFFGSVRFARASFGIDTFAGC